MKRFFSLLFFVVLMFGCAAKSKFVYVLPETQLPAENTRAVVVALVSPVEDRRSGDKAIDTIYESDPMAAMQKIIEAEMRDTGFFKKVICVSDDGKSAELVAAVETSVRISPAVLRMDWEVPNYEALLGKTFAISFLTGGIGGVIYGSTETDVYGYTSILVRVTDTMSGKVLLDKTYDGKCEEKMAKLKCDTQETKATMIGKSLKSAMEQLKKDLVAIFSRTDSASSN